MTAYYNEHDRHAAAWLRELIKENLIAPGVVDERDIQQVTEADLAGFTQVHLFAGIGGWSYALRLAGWPDDKPVWTGSCPCQPFSSAGKQLGEKDARHLWPEMRRLVEIGQPAIVFGEQVASKDGRTWLAGVRADLEALGYAVGAADLCAAGVSAPHIRQRLFWVADARYVMQPGSRQGRGVETSERRESSINAESVGVVCGLANTPSVYGPEHVNDARERAAGGADHASERRGAGRLGHANGRRLEQTNGAKQGRHSSPTSFWDAFDIITCRDQWPDGTYKARRIEPRTFPLAHGVPGRVGLLRGYGNAICPPEAAEFITAYLETTNSF